MLFDQIGQNVSGFTPINEKTEKGTVYKYVYFEYVFNSQDLDRAIMTSHDDGQPPVFYIVFP